MSVIGRYDRALVRNRRWLGGKRGLLLRFEVPVAFSETPSSGRANGLGDSYGQFLTIPHLSRRFALAVGSGLFIPTATSKGLGTGKWTLAPAVVPVWFLRGRGMLFVKFQDVVSVAGDEARPDAHFLLITPTLIHKLTRRSWVLLDSESLTDWRQDGRTGIKSGVQLGYLLPQGIGLWIKPEIWWGPHQSGEWNLKTGLVWYRR